LELQFERVNVHKETVGQFQRYRTIKRDAENRLIGITYPGQTGKTTAFSYDGLSRRVSIASTRIARRSLPRGKSDLRNPDLLPRS